MPDQAAQPADTKSRAWRYTRLVVILLIAGVLVALIGWGLGRRPAAYRRAGRFPLYMDKGGDLLLGCGITPCLTGFCVREDAFVFILRDWETGKARWQVSDITIPYADPKKSAISWTPEGEFHAAVSPDGHFFVAAAAEDATLRVRTWRDGTSQGEAALSLPSLLPKGRKAQVQHLLAGVTDGGRCFVVFDLITRAKPTINHAFAIEGNDVIAHYSGPRVPHFSPDGNTVLYRDTLARVVIDGKALRFADPVTVPDIKYRGVGAGSVAVTEDGSIYRLSGKHTLMKGFTCDTVTISGRYALLCKGNISRAVELKTGSFWEIDVPRENQGGDVTEDGRHILALFATKPGSLTGLLRNAVSEQQNHFIALYANPNRLCAWMRIDPLRPTSWWPSPDGRAVAITTERECLLYRW